MATIPNFVTPPWLEGQNAETIHARMMDSLPDNIDDTEGGFPWDFTKPTALEKAELLEFHMMETLKTMHPMWSYGIYLDYHAKEAGTERKSATEATGTVKVTGSVGLEIPQGFLFAVPATGDTAAVTFYTTETATVNLDGMVNISVKASEAGPSGNVAANTIIIMASPALFGVSDITNPQATSGGSAEEIDEALLQRLMEIYESADASFVGCDNDYKRWAKEVDGVGSAIVDPEWNGPGTVKIIIMDSNGQPANNEIVERVADYIVSPNDRDKRKAPIGATVTITAPTTKAINIACNLTASPGETLTSLVEIIKSTIKNYFEKAQSEGVVKYNRVGAIIMATEGVADYNTLTLNGLTDNITIAQDEYPAIGYFSTTAMEVL